MDLPTTFYSISITLSDDNPHPLVNTDIPFYDVNLHCYTKALYYGTGTLLEAEIGVGDVASFRNGNLRDIFIKNKTAGENGKIVAVATIPTKYIKKALDFRG